MTSELFECFDCEREFGDLSALQDHLYKKKHVRAFFCENCPDYVYPSQNSLNTHVIEVHGTGYYCSPCGRGFIDATALAQHSETKHEFFCTYCRSRPFISNRALESHIENVHDFECHVCAQEFMFKKQYEKHMRDQHASDELDKTSKRKLEVTGELPRAIANLRKAVARHNRFQCKECDAKFDQQPTLDFHLNKPHNIQCEGCTLMFVDNVSLQSHKNIHHPFQCEYCTLVFETHELLQRHVQQSHTIKCAKCPKTFTNQEGYFLHYFSCHDFKCDYCAFRGDTAIARDNHLIASHSYRHKLVCKKCLEEFESQKDLENHNSFCRTTSWYACGKKFETPGLFAGHIMEDHPLLPQSTSCTMSKDSGGYSKLQHSDTSQENPYNLLATLDQAQNNPPKDVRQVPKIEANISRTKIGTPDSGLMKAPSRPEKSSQSSWQHRCKQCPASFNYPEDLDNHKERFHKHKCTKCRAIFPEAVALEGHNNDVHSICCRQCSDVCHSLEQLWVHILTVHVNKEDDQASPGRESTFSLQSCSKIGSPLLAPVSSCSSKSSDIYFDATDMSPQKLNTVRIKVVEIGTQTPTYHCDECIATFDSDDELQLHMKHSPFHGPRALKCYECSLTVESQLELLVHLDSKPHETRWVLSMV